MAESIQPRWLIEENDKIFRKDVWERPLRAPIVADKTILIKNNTVYEVLKE
jgi:hypothetical protein